MTTWKPDDLSRIATEQELKISSPRPDGSLRDPVTIWMVGVGDDLYIRSVRGADGAWFRGADASRQGRIEAAGVTRDVSLEQADRGRGDEIDAAYREKYGASSSAVEHITSSEARATTLKVQPR
jgi:hypothetical protein